MPKLKTKKSISKRYDVKKTKTGFKILKRTDGQDHFNARENGNTKRNKRRDGAIANTAVTKTIVRGAYNPK